MTELEHMWQKMRKELSGNMLATEFLLMSANTIAGCDWGVAESFYHHYIENMYIDPLNAESHIAAFKFIY